MLKRILVPFDGSASARSALSIAASMASLSRAQLLGIFVADSARFQRTSLASAVVENLVGEVAAGEPLPPDDMLEEAERVERDVAALSTDFNEVCRNATIEGRFVSKSGNPGAIITDLARAVDLVVIGSRGKHEGVPHSKGGATVREVIDRTSRPVLVVPEEPSGQPVFLIAYDGSPASERVLVAAAELASITEMDEVHLITVSSDAEDARAIQQRAIEYLEIYDLAVTPVVLSGKPAETIRAYSKKVDASFVALGAAGESKLLDKLFGSTASHLLEDLDAAVLVVG